MSHTLPPLIPSASSQIGEVRVHTIKKADGSRLQLVSDRYIPDIIDLDVEQMLELRKRINTVLADELQRLNTIRSIQELRNELTVRDYTKAMNELRDGQDDEYR